MYYLISWTTADGRRIADQRFTAEHISNKLTELERSNAKDINIESVCAEHELGSIKMEYLLNRLANTFEQMFDAHNKISDTIYGILFNSIWARRMETLSMGDDWTDIDYELYNLALDFSRVRALIDGETVAPHIDEERNAYYTDISVKKDLKCYGKADGIHLLNVFFAAEQRMFDASCDGDAEEAKEYHDRAKQTLEEIDNLEKQINS